MTDIFNDALFIILATLYTYLRLLVGLALACKIQKISQELKLKFWQFWKTFLLVYIRIRYLLLQLGYEVSNLAPKAKKNNFCKNLEILMRERRHSCMISKTFRVFHIEKNCVLAP